MQGFDIAYTEILDKPCSLLKDFDIQNEDRMFSMGGKNKNQNIKKLHQLGKWQYLIWNFNIKLSFTLVRQTHFNPKQTQTKQQS